MRRQVANYLNEEEFQQLARWRRDARYRCPAMSRSAAESGRRFRAEAQAEAIAEAIVRSPNGALPTE